MSHLITIQSYRASIGKSTLTTNIATSLAMSGRRVGLIDLNFRDPSLHTQFGLNVTSETKTLAHFVQNPELPLDSITQPVTHILRIATEVAGEIYLIPNTAAPELADAKGDWLNELPTAVNDLVDSLELDFILIDNHAGINPVHMMQMAMCHTLITVLQPGKQDYQGTSVVLDVASELEMPSSWVIANEVAPNFDLELISRQLKQTYSCDEAFALPYSSEMMTLGDTGIFALRYSENNLSKAYKTIASKLWVD